MYLQKKNENAVKYSVPSFPSKKISNCQASVAELRPKKVPACHRDSSEKTNKR